MTLTNNKVRGPLMFAAIVVFAMAVAAVFWRSGDLSNRHPIHLDIAEGEELKVDVIGGDQSSTESGGRNEEALASPPDAAKDGSQEQVAQPQLMLWPEGTVERHAQESALQIIKETQEDDWRIKRYGIWGPRNTEWHAEQLLKRPLTDPERSELLSSIDPIELTIAEESMLNRRLSAQARLDLIDRGRYVRHTRDETNRYAANPSKRAETIDLDFHRQEAAKLGGHVTFFASGVLPHMIYFYPNPTDNPELYSSRARLDELDRQRNSILRALVERFKGPR